MEVQPWLTLSERIDSAVKLPVDSLEPHIKGVWACGAYHAWGSKKAMPWSRLLREAMSWTQRMKTSAPRSTALVAIFAITCSNALRYQGS